MTKNFWLFFTGPKPTNLEELLRFTHPTATVYGYEDSFPIGVFTEDQASSIAGKLRAGSSLYHLFNIDGKSSSDFFEPSQELPKALTPFNFFEEELEFLAVNVEDAYDNMEENLRKLLPAFNSIVEDNGTYPLISLSLQELNKIQPVLAALDEFKSYSEPLRKWLDRKYVEYAVAGKQTELKGVEISRQNLPESIRVFSLPPFTGGPEASDLEALHFISIDTKETLYLSKENYYLGETFIIAGTPDNINRYTEIFLEETDLSKLSYKDVNPKELLGEFFNHAEAGALLAITMVEDKVKARQIAQWLDATAVSCPYEFYNAQDCFFSELRRIDKQNFDRSKFTSSFTSYLNHLEQML